MILGRLGRRDRLLEVSDHDGSFVQLDHGKPQGSGAHGGVLSGKGADTARMMRQSRTSVCVMPSAFFLRRIRQRFIRLGWTIRFLRCVLQASASTANEKRRSRPGEKIGISQALKAEVRRHLGANT